MRKLIVIPTACGHGGDRCPGFGRHEPEFGQRVLQRPLLSDTTRPWPLG